MHPIAERIIDGETVCPAEIKQDGAMRIDAWAANGSHDPKDCRWGKNCIHGAGPQDIAHATTMRAEMPSVCTCGNHR